MGIIERRLALIEKSKKWAEETDQTKKTNIVTKKIKKEKLSMKLGVKERSPQSYFFRTVAAVGLVANFVLFIDHVTNNSQSIADERPTQNNQVVNSLPESEKLEFELTKSKRVIVTGTGTDGLFLRNNPGLDPENIESSTWDGESFLTTGQSAEADGLLWLQIEDENGNIYWAASDYLK